MLVRCHGAMLPQFLLLSNMSKYLGVLEKFGASPDHLPVDTQMHEF